MLGNGFFDAAPGNGLYLELDGSSNNAARLESKTAFSFAPGDTVTLTFDILGNRGSNETLQVSLGSILNGTFTQNDVGLNTLNGTVLSATSENLIFDHAGDDNNGLLLDNVVLTSTSVPEFTPTLGFILIGGIFGITRCKKHRQANTLNCHS